MDESTYYIYILRCIDNSLYTGITSSPERRFREHIEKGKKGAKYTHTHTPLYIAALWSTKSGRKMASRLEYFIKRLPKEKKELLLLEPEKINLLIKEKIPDGDFSCEKRTDD